MDKILIINKELLRIAKYGIIYGIMTSLDIFWEGLYVFKRI